MAVSKNCTRVNFNIPNELLEKIDNYAKEINVNRTAAVCSMISQYLKQDDAIQTLKNVVSIYANTNKAE